MPPPSSSNRTPFLDVTSFATEDAAPLLQLTHPAPASGSPFLTLYESAQSDEAVDARTDEYVAFLGELYDEELDEAVFELVNEAASHDRRFVDASATTDADDPARERLLEQHFEPLARELERTFDVAADRLGSLEPYGIAEGEVEAFFNGYRPEIELSPAFEQFLGAITKGLKKVAGKAVALAKKGTAFAGNFLLGPLLKKLKALIRPLLKRVLRLAIGKLPVPLQPVARNLATRLGLLKEREGNEPEFENGSAADISAIQREFNEQVANVLFATSAGEQDLELSHAAARMDNSTAGSLDALDRARDRFIDELNQLQDGEDPTPLVENFIPALLPVLKTGLKLVGRKRVVNLLARLLSRLIARFVGRQQAKALSRAIVDAGLKLLNLEVTPQDESRAAGAAVAATVEDTVGRVAALPQYVLDDPELLEAFALEAFEQAAAVNLPPILPADAYVKRPELREADSVRAVWVALPLQGRKRYKKFCHVPRVRITPHKARTVESFGGVPLSELLQVQFGVPAGTELEADVHLYESIPGTRLPEIARLERTTPGLGTDAGTAYRQMHPLTTEAAATLLDEPALGRDSAASRVGDYMTIAPGQRFYYLSIPGFRPIVTTDARGRSRTRRPAGLTLTLDFPSRQLRAYLYLDEIRAQELATRLRRKAHIADALIKLRQLTDRGLVVALRPGGRGRLKIIHERVGPGQAVGGALARVPIVVLDGFHRALHEWLIKALAGYLKLRGPQFVTAAESPDDGLTLVATVAEPPGLETLGQLLRGRMPSGASGFAGSPAVDVDVVTGYARG